MMSVHNLIQGTDEWYAFRKEHYTASDAAAMLGLSPYKTRDQLLHEKYTGITPEVTPARQALFDEGHRTEEAQREITERLIHEEFFPATATNDEYPKLAASFDGITMDEELLFEHKMWNQDLVNYISGTGDLPDSHWPQIEQQLLISGAKCCLFVVSNGTEEMRYTTHYVSNPERAKRVVDGWMLFDADLKSYTPTEKKEKVTADTTYSLPILTYDFDKTTLVIRANVVEYKAKAFELVEKSKEPLATDQDFANAESMLKTFKSAETKLGDIATSVMGEIESIDQFVTDVNEIREMLRQARLNTEKQVKNRKDEIKNELIRAAKLELLKYRNQTDTPFEVRCWKEIDATPATKNKRTVESLTSSVNQYIADYKLYVNEVLGKVGLIAPLIQSHSFLFNDIGDIFLREDLDIASIIKGRIDDYEEQQAEKAAEEKRIAEQAAERERLVVEQAKTQADTPEQLLEQEPLLNTQEQAPENKAAKLAGEFLLKMEQNGKIEEMVSITRAEYNRLVKSDRILSALRAGGVDNWAGYDDAMQNLQLD